MLPVIPTQMIARVGLDAIEKWRSGYPSSDDDTCRAGYYLLPQPRWWHVQGWMRATRPKRNCLEREKNLAIKVNLTEFEEVRFSLRLISRVVCTLVRFYKVYFLSVFGCSCHWLERRSATGRRGATLCFSGSQRGYLWCGREGHMVSSWWGGSWRGNALALGQPAGSVDNFGFLIFLIECSFMCLFSWSFGAFSF